ncbi:MAG: hypothetical protein ACXWQE_07255 [Bdellovibrionales bacterium]
MLAKIIATMGLLSLSGAAVADESVSVRCENVDVFQFTPLHGDLQPPEVLKRTLIATRTGTADGDDMIYKTEGKHLNDKGDVISTYTSTRKTKKIVLNDSSYREVSEIEYHSELQNEKADPKTKDSKYRTVSDYQRQPDGSYNLVKMYRDGRDVTGSESSQTIEAANGDIYNFSWSTAPQDDPDAFGNSRNLSSKEICVIKKN